ncbi:MAG: RNA 2',3'-cyclic phosphodiesterase [Planctomycetota bacterium]|nr:MAG: RNA 2',3'-cyclic phosphodiesterase [Planctomycetota bacterium]
MIRLFLGIPIPEELRIKITRLSSGIPGAKWVDKENYHLTLRFFGNVNEIEYDDIADVIEKTHHKKFNVSLTGLDVFPNRGKPKTLWLKVDQCGPVISLKRKIDLLLREELKMKEEDEKFIPHITIARFKEVALNKLISYLEFNSHFKIDAFPITQFNLVQSHLTKSGAIYQVLDEFILGD